MTHDARLTQLERNLMPRQAVLRWLDQAHGQGTLEAYVRSIIDDPSASGPQEEISSQVEGAVRAAMQTLPQASIEQAALVAKRDAAFLIGLAIGLNAAAIALLESGASRLEALIGSPEASDTSTPLEADATKPHHASDLSGEAWARQADELLLDLLAAHAARRQLEGRYLGGCRVLFPDVWVDSISLLTTAADLISDDEGRQGPIPTGPDAPCGPAIPIGVIRLLACPETLIALASRKADAVVRKALSVAVLQVGNGKDGAELFRAVVREPGTGAET